MGDMGLSGAFASGSLQQLLRQRMLDQIAAQQSARHNLESDRAFGLQQQEANSNEALKRDALDANVANRAATQQKNVFDENQQLNEATPAGTLMSPSAPTFGRLMSIGALSQKGVEEQQPPAALAENPMAPAEIPGTVENSPLQPMSSGRLYRKDATSNQAKAKAAADEKQQEFQTTTAANATKESDLVRQRADANGQRDAAIQRELGRDAETKRHNLAQENKPVNAPGAAQAAQHEQSKKEALGSLDQVDQAIEAARAFIGPGRGQFSSLEQMIGAQDPKLNALATKMLLTKMQVDHAASGTVRAGASPTLLARWDNVLGQKVTPEALKASVQAMREILGGQSGAESGGLPTVGGTFQGGKVLKVEKVQ